jgi:hypothetical protein
MFLTIREGMQKHCFILENNKSFRQRRKRLNGKSPAKAGLFRYLHRYVFPPRFCLRSAVTLKQFYELMPGVFDFFVIYFEKTRDRRELKQYVDLLYRPMRFYVGEFEKRFLFWLFMNPICQKGRSCTRKLKKWT